MFGTALPAGPVRQHSVFIRDIARVETDNIDQARESLIRATKPHRYDAVRTQDFFLRHWRLTMVNVSINVLYYRPKSFVSTHALEDFFCFLFPVSGEQWLDQQGDRHVIGPGEAFVVDPTRRFDQVISPENRMINIRVDRDTFDDFLRETIGRRALHPLAFSTAPVTVSSASSLLEFVQFLCRDCQDGDSFGAGTYQGVASQQMERSLLTLLLAGLPNNYEQFLGSRRQQASTLVGQVEAFIHANLAEPLSVADIAAAAGVSERTIYYAFAQHYGLTPLQFLKIERLKLARTMLQRTDGRRLSVCDVAMSCGFNHLSKFASDYRRQFGELPRETIRKYR